MSSLSSKTLLVFLWLAVVSSAALTECPPNQTDPEYKVISSQAPAERVHSSAGSLEPLYDFARLFLKAVQPYGFPLDIASRVSKNEAPASEYMPYEAGYVACLILAVLYMLIIPIVGAVLAWRYFHHKNLQIETEPSSPLPWHQRNIIVIPCLSVVVILLFSGVILTFTTNSKIHHNLPSNLFYLKTDIGVFENALSSVPKKVDFIVDQFPVFREEIMEELRESDELIDRAIFSSFNPQINMLRTSLDITVQDATGAQRHLQEVQDIRTKMQGTYGFLQEELQQMRNRLNELNSTLNTSSLDVDANFDMIPNVDAEVQRLSLVSKLKGVENQVVTLCSLRTICAYQIMPQIEGLAVALNETEVKFRNYSKKLPSLKSLSDALSDIQASFDKSKASIYYYDYIRWSVSVTFCTLILIITLLMLAGLVIGSSVVISPTLYHCCLPDRLRLTTVHLLYVASGMIFILSWLFIIMVFVNLLVAGNIYALTCRSSSNGEIFEFLDKQDFLFNSLNANNPADSDIVATNQTLNNTYNINDRPDHERKAIKTFEIYQGCEEGRSLFYSLHMDDTFDMDDFLNTNKYLTQFNKNMQALSVDLHDVMLILTKTQAIVEEFSNYSNLDQINYNDLRVLLARPVVKTDLDTFAETLATAALTANDSVRENLTSEAAKARQLAKTVRLQDQNRRNMSSSVEALATISQYYKVNANNTLLRASKTGNWLRVQVPYIVQNVSECMTERASEMLSRYFGVVRYTIIDKALGCRWLPVSLGNMYTATCDNLIAPWNAFWLCLGWCCAFLVPGLIFSILAARIWRPPSLSDKEPFHMLDIVDIGTPNSFMTLEDVKDKGEMKPSQEPEEHTHQIMNNFTHFKNDGDMKKSDIYETMG